MTDIANTLITNSPGLVPIGGISLGLVVGAFAVLIAYVLVVVLYPGFADSVSASGETHVILYSTYIPGISALGGQIAQLPGIVSDFIGGFGNLLSGDIIKFIIYLIIAIFLAVLWIPFHNTVISASAQFYTCTIVPLTGIILQLENAASLLASAIVPIYNFFVGFYTIFIGTLFIRRVLIDCQISDGGANTFQAALALITQLVDGVIAFVTAITDWLSSGDLLNTRVDFEPALVLLLGVTTQLTPLFNCACNFLSFLWIDLFALPSSPSLVQAVDCALNVPFTLIQELLIGIETPEVPQVNITAVELQCVVVSLGEFVQICVLFVFNFLLHFIENIVAIAETDPTATAILLNGGSFALPSFQKRNAHGPALVIKKSSSSSSKVTMAKRQFTISAQAMAADAIFTFREAGFPANFSGNITNVTAIIDYFTKIFESNYLGTVTYTVAGAIALINGTWSLTQLLTLPLAVNNTFGFEKIQYFQVGYVLDWVRLAGYSLGTFIGAIVANNDFGLFIGGVVSLVSGAAQVVVELFVNFLFYNSFFPPVSNNPFQYATVYCNANDTQPHFNYLLMLNTTAELAIAFGCNVSTSVFPINSTFATCEDNVFGCIALSLGRFIGELVKLILEFVCDIPVLIRFQPPLFYSPPPPGLTNPVLINFGNISIDGVAREWLNLGICLQNLFYEFDKDINITLGDPPGVTCQYIDPTQPAGIGFKISWFCTLGNMIRTAMQGVGALIYEVVNSINKMLAAIAFAPLASDIRIPTFGDTLRDLQVFACQIGALLALILPITFSCSAQLGGTGNPLIPTPPPPPPQFFFYPSIPFVAQRSPADVVCSYTPASWSIGSNGTCDCTAIANSWYHTPITPFTGGCYLTCLDPGVGFHLGVGTNISIPPPCFGNTTATVFSTKTAMQTFLGMTFGAITGFNMGTALNPTNASSYGPNGFMQEFIAALLNDNYNRMYQPQYNIIYNQQPACVPTTGVGVVDTNMNAVVPFYAQFFSNAGLTWSDILNVIGMFFYGDAANFVMGDTSNRSLCYFPTIVGTQGGSSQGAPRAFAIQLALAINNTLTQGGTWAGIARWFQIWLSNYNQAFTSCDVVTSPFAACFARNITPATSAPFPGIAPNTTFPTDPATICTNTPADYTTAGGCNCSASTYTAGNAGCRFRVCDPPPYPITIGHRNDFCLFPSRCSGHAIQIDNLTEATAWLQLDGILPDVQPILYDEPPGGLDANTADLVSLLLAAKLNYYYMRRYRPGQFIYMRTSLDVNFRASCINSTVAENVFGGQEMGVILDVINDVWLSSNNFPYDCGAYYSYASFRWTLCASMQQFFAPFITLSDPNGNWTSNTTQFILPILRSWNQYQYNCQPTTTCFFTSTFDVGKLTEAAPIGGLTNFQWTNTEYLDIQPVDVKDMVPCGSTVRCEADFFCAAGQLIFILGGIISGVAQKVNDVIALGPQQWNIGETIWDILKQVLQLTFFGIAAIVVRLGGWIDCIVCAVSGNVRKNGLCTALLFNSLKTIFSILEQFIIPFITFVVNTFEDGVNFIVAFVNGDFGGAWKAILKFFTDLGTFFGTLFVNLIGLLFGAIQACDAYHVLFGQDKPCTNTPGTGAAKAKKRGLMDDTDETFTIPVGNRTHPIALYQRFAPDWPAKMGTKYNWPSSHSCNHHMKAYASRLAQGGNLTSTEKDEVAFCLSVVVLFPNYNVDTSAYTSNGDMNECVYIMKELSVNQEPFQIMPLGTRARVLYCINAYAKVYGPKRAAKGLLDWLPDNAAIINWLDFETILPMARAAMDAFSVSNQQRNDAMYTEPVLNSPEYRANLHTAYGQARVDLLHQALVTGEVAPLDHYADAILNKGANLANRTDGHVGVVRKRALEDIVTDADEYTARVVSLATMISAFQDVLSTELPKAIVSAVDSVARTSLPPLYSMQKTNNPIQPYVSTPMTDAYFAYSARPINSSIELAMAMHTTAGQRAHSILAMFKLFNQAPPPHAAAVPTPGAGKRRVIIVQGDTGRARFLSGVGDSTAPPSFISTAYQGARHGISAVYEIFTGAAYKNATGDSSVATKFKWLIINPTAASSAPATTPGPGIFASAAIRAQRLMGPKFYGNLANYYSLVLAGFYHLRSIDSISTERVRRIRVVTDAVSNAYTLATQPHYSISNTSNGSFVVDGSFCFNLTGPELCTKCFAADQAIGYGYLLGKQVYYCYNASASPTVGFTLNYSLAQFNIYRAYILNNSAPLMIGNSDSLPAKFAFDGLTWDYLDDRTPNKVGFNAWQPLFNATYQFILSVFSGVNFLTANPLTMSTSSADTIGTATATNSSINSAAYWESMHYLPRRVAPGSDLSDLVVGQTLNMLGIFGMRPSLPPSSRASQKRSVTDVHGQLVLSSVQVDTGPYDTFLEILEGWVLFVWDEFIFCSFSSELDGTNLRYSLLQGFFIALIPGILMALFINYVASGILSYILTNAITNITANLAGGVTFVFFWFGMATGWKVLCSPTIPNLLFTALLTPFLNDVLPKCLVVYSGLIKETTYSRNNCMQCHLYQQSHWHFFNCRDDLHWNSPLDVPVVFLQYYFPATLATILNPANFAFPFNSIIATPAIQNYLTRWGSVDFTNLDVRSSQLTCLWGVELLPFLVFLVVLGFLLSFGPVLQTLKSLFAILGLLASVVFYFLFALFCSSYYILIAPDRIYFHSIDRLLELEKAETVIRDKELLSRLRRGEYSN